MIMFDQSAAARVDDVGHQPRRKLGAVVNLQ
jgi:hypothetical protein